MPKFARPILIASVTAVLQVRLVLQSCCCFFVGDGYLIYPFGLQAFVRLQVTVMASQTVMKQMSTAVVGRRQSGSTMQGELAKMAAILALQYARQYHIQRV